MQALTSSQHQPISSEHLNKRDRSKTPLRHEPTARLKRHQGDYTEEPLGDDVTTVDSNHPKEDVDLALSGTINPDLPTRDTLFLFVNFDACAKIPYQGAQGISEASLRHAARMLNHARDLSRRVSNRNSILHVKYRFPLTPSREQYEQGIAPRERKNALSVLLDPRIRIQMRLSGSFEPPFASAVFQHMLESCKSVPKYIVLSYVGANVTVGNLKDLTVWCAHSSPPIMVFSPTETRIREHLPLEESVGDDVIDVPMYFTPLSHPWLTEPQRGLSQPTQHGHHHHTPVSHQARENSTSTHQLTIPRSLSKNSMISTLCAREQVLRQLGILTKESKSAGASGGGGVSAGTGQQHHTMTPGLDSWDYRRMGAAVGASSWQPRGVPLENLIDHLGLGDGSEAGLERLKQQAEDTFPATDEPDHLVTLRRAIKSVRETGNDCSDGDDHDDHTRHFQTLWQLASVSGRRHNGAWGDLLIREYERLNPELIDAIAL